MRTLAMAALAALTGGLLAGAAGASLVEEGFGPGYADDATVVGLGPARTGFAASPWAAGTIDIKRDVFHRAGGLVHPLVDGATPGHLEAWVDGLQSPPNGGSVSRALAYNYTDPDATDQVWGAFLFQFNAVAGSLKITLGDATGSNRPAEFIITVAGGTGTLETHHAGNSADVLSVGGLAPDVAHLAVFRMRDLPDTYYDPHSLWVDPDPADVLADDIAGGQSGVAITLNPNLDKDTASAWGSLRLETHSGNGSRILFDEFRLRESLGEMGLTPEPATLAMVALGGLGLMAARKRR